MTLSLTPEAMYRFTERLGIMRGSNPPTYQQWLYASSAASRWQSANDVGTPRTEKIEEPKSPVMYAE